VIGRRAAQGSSEAEKRSEGGRRRRDKSFEKKVKNFLQNSKNILTFAVPKQTGKETNGARPETK
jgi:hypothetical protein